MVAYWRQAGLRLEITSLFELVRSFYYIILSMKHFSFVLYSLFENDKSLLSETLSEWYCLIGSIKICRVSTDSTSPGEISHTSFIHQIFKTVSHIFSEENLVIKSVCHWFPDPPRCRPQGGLYVRRANLMFPQRLGIVLFKVPRVILNPLIWSRYP